MPTKLELAMKAVESGNLSAGQSLLAQVIREDPGNENAWLWLANVLDDPLKKRQCLEKVFQINPDNEQAWREMARLEAGLEATQQDQPVQVIMQATSQTPEMELATSPVPPPAPAAPKLEPTDGEEEKQDESNDLGDFWASLQSVKKETGEPGSADSQEELSSFDFLDNQDNQKNEENQAISYPWFTEEGQGLETVQPSEKQPESFDDFLQTLKASDETQGDEVQEIPAQEEDLSSEASIWEEEEETEEGWADTSINDAYITPARQDELQPITVSSPTAGSGRKRSQQPKMSRSQTNIIILLAVITFLILIAALAYIILNTL